MSNDYSAFTRAAPTTDQLSQLSALVKQMHDAEIAAEEAEAELTKRKETVRQYAEVQIPELMASMGVAEITTSGGLKVKVRRSYSAAPLVENREAAYDWLEKNGHGGLVKRSIEVGFSVKEGEVAMELMGELQGRFENVKGGRKVEPASLRAWAKQQFETGVEFPRELFNARAFDKAEIKST